MTFDSTRSPHLEEGAAIAVAAGLPHIARAPSWRANWVPFPYWPPSEHYGRMLSGGAILSRFPIVSNVVELLPKPDEQPFWYILFYLFRFLARAEIDVGGRRLTVWNAHLEAFHAKNRMLHARLVRDRIAGDDNTRVLFGGDMNALPPEATKKRGFDDDAKADHEGDDTVDILRGISALRDVFATTSTRSSESDHFTFPSHAPNRKLDHLFVGNGLDVLEARVAREVGTPSDHLPIIARITIAK